MIKKIDKGYSFSLGKRAIGLLSVFLGVAFLIIDGVVFLSSGYFFFFFLMILGGALLFSGMLLFFGKEYLIINYENKEILDVLNVLGLKWKKKSKLNNYKYISVISRRFSYDKEYYSEATLAMPSFNEFTYKHDLVFLTPKHLGRLLISQFDDYNEALELGEAVSKHTGKPLVKYSPKSISKTRRR